MAAKKDAVKKVTKKRSVSAKRKPTDLEAHVDAEGRDKLVKQVRRKINELGIQLHHFGTTRSNARTATFKLAFIELDSGKMILRPPTRTETAAPWGPSATETAAQSASQSAHSSQTAPS